MVVKSTKKIEHIVGDHSMIIHVQYQYTSHVFPDQNAMMNFCR